MKHLAIKVTNKYESEEVQRALFDMGFSNDGQWTDIEDYTFIMPRKKECKTYKEKLKGMGVRYGWDHEIEECCMVVSFEEFFRTYAGHIERFPDYVSEQESMESAEKLWRSLKIKTLINSMNITKK
jgi:hypothetical protein